MRRHKPDKKIVLGVLTPHTGGFYYGSVINGILQAVRRSNAVAIAFETSRLRLLQGREVLSFNQVDGWLAINEFDDPDLLAELRAREATIVHLHSKPDVPHGSAVLPDNEGGARAVTEHLIRHGHQRIAFAGNLDHVDIAERYVGFQVALEAAGLSVRPDLVFDTPHHKHEDGSRVARELLGRARQHKGRWTGFSATALVGATDRVALGALHTFVQSGVRVPEDVALVGFDDSDAAQFAEPPLTTVKQSFPVAAARAVDELLSAIAERRRPETLLRVPAEAVVRRSCGCVLSHSTPPRLSRSSDERVFGLTRELLNYAGRNQLKRVSISEWPEAEKIARTVELSERGTSRVEAVYGDWWTGFLEQTRDAESVVRVMDLLESTVRSWGLLDDESRQAWGTLRDLRVALMHQWQRSERTRVDHYESVTEAAYRLANALSSSGTDPSRELEWIQYSDAYSACCALWENQRREEREVEGALESNVHASPCPEIDPAAFEPGLVITGKYPRLDGTLETMMSPADFPPKELIDIAAEEGAVVSIAGVPQGRGGEYGLLAVVAPLAFEHLQYVGTPGDWGVQLGAALDRAHAERELRASAELDALTGLANRATLLERVEALRSLQEPPPFVLLFIDLDDFKKINDSLGHEAGDLLLIQIARRLSIEATLFGQDHNLVARVGGDEFAVILKDIVSESQAVEAVQRLQDQLRQPYILQGRTVFVSASIGVNFGKLAQKSAKDLLRGADTALYRAKKRGRDRHEIFHHGMHAQALEKLHLDARLRLALKEDEFELWYQPISDLQTGREVGTEALIRWRDPERGLLSPDRFLSIAEEVGLIIPMSEWTIRRACADAASWRLPLGYPAPTVNVNVPAAHIKHPGFVDYVFSALKESGLAPERLGIEILESALLDEPEKGSRALRQLRDLGIRIAIDDFGTGYSNLSYLRDFPITSLKIDRSFIRNVPGSTSDNGIVRAMAAMAKELHLSTVAEGIETEDQLHFLEQIGCDYGQGFLLSLPLEHSRFVAHLWERPSVRAAASD